MKESNLPGNASSTSLNVTYVMTSSTTQLSSREIEPELNLKRAAELLGHNRGKGTFPTRTVSFVIFWH